MAANTAGPTRPENWDHMTTYNKQTIADLIDSQLPWEQVHEMMSGYKDPRRFDTYIEILQERVPWDDKILLPLGLALIHRTETGRIEGHQEHQRLRVWRLPRKLETPSQDLRSQDR